MGSGVVRTPVVHRANLLSLVVDLSASGAGDHGVPTFVSQPVSITISTRYHSTHGTGDDRRRGGARGRFCGDGLESDQRPLRRRRGDLRADPGGDRRARVPREPRRPEPAEPAHECDRRARPRHRAFSAELLKGVAEGIHGTGFELVVFSGCGQQPDQAGWERRYLARISGTLADGVILVTPGSVNAAAGSPVVAVDHNVHSSELPTVDSENFLGAVSAVEYLIGLGHRRIGFVAGRADLESARLREVAYRHALEQAGIAFDPMLVREGGYQPETASEATNGLLALEVPPTAIFAANDGMALAVIAAATARGLAIPSDLSVIGFDNVPESALATPPLTTVEQPIRQMGVEAVRILMALLEEPTRAPERVVLPTRLVVRHSCRASPARPPYQSPTLPSA